MPHDEAAGFDVAGDVQSGRTPGAVSSRRFAPRLVDQHLDEIDAPPRGYHHHHCAERHLHVHVDLRATDDRGCCLWPGSSVRRSSYRAASAAGRGAPPPVEASVAKCFANEMAKRVSDMAMLIHGGYGYAADYGIERYHRDAHGWAIAGGTPTMQRIRIASEYLGRRFDQRV